MQGTLLLVGRLAAYFGLLAAFLAFLIWVVALNDPKAKGLANSWLWAMFWPIVWLFSRFGGNDSASLGRQPALQVETRGRLSEIGLTDQRLRRFRTIREAKDYLAGKIAEEAVRKGAPLTEVERKMLYFSETGWTLPEMKAVSAEFDRDYKQDEYERRIAGLVRGIEKSEETQSEEEKDAWYQAVLKLCNGDHYLLVLIDAASAEDAIPSRWGWLRLWLPDMTGRREREPGDFMRLILVVLAGSVVMIAIDLLFTWLFGPNWRRFGDPPPAWFR